MRGLFTITAFCLIFGGVSPPSFGASTPGSVAQPPGYKSIPERNIFRLKDPPPPVADPGPAPEPPPKIILSGITTVLGKKMALLKLPATPKTAQTNEQTFLLAEGQRDGQLQVLQINELAGTVKVNEFGTVTTLTFDKNGVKSAAPALSPGTISQAREPGPGTSSVPPVPASGAVPRPGSKTLPTRYSHPGNAGLPGGTIETNAGAFGAQSVNTNLSPTGYPGHGAGSQPSQTPAGTPMSAEEQKVLLDLEQRLARTNAAPVLPQ